MVQIDFIMSTKIHILFNNVSVLNGVKTDSDHQILRGYRETGEILTNEVNTQTQLDPEAQNISACTHASLHVAG